MIKHRIYETDSYPPPVTFSISTSYMDVSTFIECVAEITKIGFENMHDIGDPQQITLTLPYKNFLQLQTFVLDLIQQAARNLDITASQLINNQNNQTETKRIFALTQNHLSAIKRLRNLSDSLTETERQYLHARISLTKTLGENK